VRDREDGDVEGAGEVGQVGEGEAGGGDGGGVGLSDEGGDGIDDEKGWGGRLGEFSCFGRLEGGVEDVEALGGCEIERVSAGRRLGLALGAGGVDALDSVEFRGIVEGVVIPGPTEFCEAFVDPAFGDGCRGLWGDLGGDGDELALEEDGIWVDEEDVGGVGVEGVEPGEDGIEGIIFGAEKKDRRGRCRGGRIGERVACGDFGGEIEGEE